MGYKELIESLQREAEENVKEVWHEAKAQAEKLKAETDKKLELMKQQYAEMQSSAAKEQAEEILSETKSEVQRIKLSTEAALSKRLYPIALSYSSSLRNERYKDVFSALAGEVPPFKWHTVKVNPADKGLAKEYFPDSEIVSDPEITCGMEVVAEDSRIRIINTFEKRLENAWPEMVTALIKDVYTELERRKSPSNP